LTFAIFFMSSAKKGCEYFRAVFYNRARSMAYQVCK